MAWCVDKIQLKHLSITSGVVQGDTLRLDGNAPFSLDVHRVENLRRHFALRQPSTALDEPIGERRLAVIDVGNDRKVANL